jgi:hypothetical protein
MLKKNSQGTSYLYEYFFDLKYLRSTLKSIFSVIVAKLAIVANPNILSGVVGIVRGAFHLPCPRPVHALALSAAVMADLIQRIFTIYWGGFVRRHLSTLNLDTAFGELPGPPVNALSAAPLS